MQPNNLTDLHDAYVAGIIDGEGGIGVSVMGGGALNLRVYVGNTNEELLSALQCHFGGHVSLHDKATSNHKAVWRWTVSGIATRVVLDTVRPHCIIKRRHVLLGLAFLETPKEDGEKRARIAAALKFLNRRGPYGSREDTEINGRGGFSEE